MKLSGELPGIWLQRDNYRKPQIPDLLIIIMKAARKEIWDRYKIIYRPVDRRDNYVKRCIGIPGDTLVIKKGSVYIKRKTGS